MRLSEMMLCLVEKGKNPSSVRIKALELLFKWQDIILEDGKTIDSPFFHRNGRLTSAFAEWVDSKGIGCSGFNKIHRTFFTRSILRSRIKSIRFGVEEI